MRPTLTRQVATAEGSRGRADVSFPEARQLELPERIVQFGTGALLRGLIDAQIDEATRRGHYDGRIVAIGSTESGRDSRINAQHGLFTLVVQGIEGGRVTRECRVVGSVSRAISASRDWAAVLACARNPWLEVVFSNTTEVGITFDDDDARDGPGGTPRSFPAKLTAFLYERARAFAYARDKGVVVIPCELIEDNGDTLRATVIALAEAWALPAGFRRWLERHVQFCNTLVDRIVPGAPSATEGASLAEQLGYEDAMVTTCEPYRLLAIQGDDALRERLRFARRDVGVIVADDITPYRLRKVRLLNGGHTVMVSLALLAGCETVRDAVMHEQVGGFLRTVLLDEIVPFVNVPGAQAFATDVLERFANPYIHHQLRDIALHCGAKMKVRVLPSIVAHVEHTRRVPALLSLGFAAYLLLAREDRDLPADDVRDELRRRWAEVKSDQALLAFTRGVCADTSLWGRNLDALTGFSALVAQHLAALMRHGAAGAMASLPGSRRRASGAASDATASPRGSSRTAGDAHVSGADPSSAARPGAA